MDDIHLYFHSIVQWFLLNQLQHPIKSFHTCIILSYLLKAWKPQTKLHVPATRHIHATMSRMIMRFMRFMIVFHIHCLKGGFQRLTDSLYRFFFLKSLLGQALVCYRERKCSDFFFRTNTWALSSSSVFALTARLLCTYLCTYPDVYKCITLYVSPDE